MSASPACCASQMHWASIQHALRDKFHETFDIDRATSAANVETHGQAGLQSKPSPAAHTKPIGWGIAEQAPWVGGDSELAPTAFEQKTHRRAGLPSAAGGLAWEPGACAPAPRPGPLTTSVAVDHPAPRGGPHRSHGRWRGVLGTIHSLAIFVRACVRVRVCVCTQGVPPIEAECLPLLMVQ